MYAMRLFTCLVAASVSSAAAVPASTSCTSSVLQHPTAVTAFANGVATNTYNHGLHGIYGTFVLPFNVGIAGNQQKKIVIDARGTVQTATHNRYGAFTYWDVYYEYNKYTITKGLPQGVFFSIEGVAPNRTANIEWRLGIKSMKIPNATWHFGLQFYESEPDIARLKYWDIPLRRRQDTEVSYYREYYFPDRVIKTGDVLLFKSYDSGSKESSYSLGPRSACEYRGPPDD